MAIDPIENIQKFMHFVKEEQDKLKTKERRKSARKRRAMKKMGKPKALPHDSASDITDLEEEGILNKYYEEQMTNGQKRAKERKKVQDRLYGVGDKLSKHICSTSHNRPNSVQPKVHKLVKMELREIEEPVSMMDESNSAHQFSLQDQSVQADSEARHEMGMQTSLVEKKSQGYQYSRQDVESRAMQCSDVDHMS